MFEQGANIWVVLLGLVSFGPPILLPFTVLGTILPTIVVWNDGHKGVKTALHGIGAMFIGPLLAQLSWTVWGFIILRCTRS